MATAIGWNVYGSIRPESDGFARMRHDARMLSSPCAAAVTARTPES